MDNRVNERVVSVKNSLKLTDIEFCNKAKISTGTLHRIKNGSELSSKTLTLICDSLSLNRDWLINGVGEMFLPGQAQTGSVSEIWKDEAYSGLKAQNEFLKNEIEWLRGLVTSLSGKTGSANFLNATELAGFTGLPWGSLSSVRVGA